MHTRKQLVSRSVLDLFSLILAGIFIFPVIWTLFVSLKPEGTAVKTAWDWFLPPYTFAIYPDIILKTSVLRWLSNSVLVAVVVTCFGVLFVSMAGYALSKINFPFKEWVFGFFLLGIMVPQEATIVPLFLTAKTIGITDSYLGLILPALAGSMNVIIVTSFFRSIPNELVESMTIDGANHIQVYKNLILPLGKTVLVTISIFTFIANWNSYLWPFLCIYNDQMFTLPIGIPTFISQNSVDYVRPLSAALVASVPVIVMFLLFEKRIVKGISMSGIKG